MQHTFQVRQISLSGFGRGLQHNPIADRNQCQFNSIIPMQFIPNGLRDNQLSLAG